MLVRLNILGQEQLMDILHIKFNIRKDRFYLFVQLQLFIPRITD